MLTLAYLYDVTHHVRVCVAAARASGAVADAGFRGNGRETRQDSCDEASERRGVDERSHHHRSTPHRKLTRVRHQGLLPLHNMYRVPVWGLPGEDKLKEEGPGTRAPVRREQQLERRPQRDPQRERANAAVRSRVLEQPQRERRQTTAEEDERRIIRELASDLDMRRKRLGQHKLTVSPTRPQQEVSPTRRSVHESRSEPTFSPKRQVYVEEREKAAAARAALVVENVKRTEESELDEEAILDDTDQPQLDFAEERERSDGELHSDEEATSVMDTDPPAATSQRTPEIADVTEFPEVHRVNRTRKRCQPDETPAVIGRVPQSDPIHSERQPYDLDLEFLATLPFKCSYDCKACVLAIEEMDTGSRGTDLISRKSNLAS